jgi:nudix-type nucleoside diphosphatase (YffH/AdpP family)
MKKVFLCGPWALSPLRERLGVGGGAAGVLDDGRLVLPEGAIFPVLNGQAAGEITGQIAGLVVEVEEDAWACVEFLAKVLEWRIVPRDVNGHEVRVVLPPEGQAGDAWDPDDWTAHWGQIAARAVDEMLEHRSRCSAAQMRGRLPMVYARAAAQVAARQSVPAEVRRATGIDTVEPLSRETPHVGFFLTRAYELRHPGFDGGMSPRMRREVFVATDAAIVLPYDPLRDRVLLVEQFRMGPFGRGDARPWTLEPVAGRVDAGETPAETARRECMEEAGLTLRHMEHISSHYCSPGCSTEYFHLYLGLCDLPEVEKGQGGLDSEDEDIRTHVIPFDHAMQLLQTGEADNGPLVLSLLWLQRERGRLRASA